MRDTEWKNAVTQALTLADLKDIKPLYISNVVVNAWRREFNQKYCMVTMSPEGQLITRFSSSI